MDSMPGTPATFASYIDPASPAPTAINLSPLPRSSNRMDMECQGSGGSSNGSDTEGGPGGGRGAPVMPKLWV